MQWETLLIPKASVFFLTETGAISSDFCPGASSPVPCTLLTSETWEKSPLPWDSRLSSEQHQSSWGWALRCSGRCHFWYGSQYLSVGRKEHESSVSLLRKLRCVCVQDTSSIWISSQITWLMQMNRKLIPSFSSRLNSSFYLALKKMASLKKMREKLAFPSHLSAKPNPMKYWLPKSKLKVKVLSIILAFGPMYF